jgi:hypothetical protein
MIRNGERTSHAKAELEKHWQVHKADDDDDDPAHRQAEILTHMTYVAVPKLHRRMALLGILLGG